MAINYEKVYEELRGEMVKKVGAIEITPEVVFGMVEEIVLLRLQRDLAVEAITDFKDFFEKNNIGPGAEIARIVLSSLAEDT